jgi:hypothetical protein
MSPSSPAASSAPTSAEMGRKMHEDAAFGRAFRARPNFAPDGKGIIKCDGASWGRGGNRGPSRLDRIMPGFPRVNTGTAAFLQQVHRLPHRKVPVSWNGHIVFGTNERG